MEIMSLATSAEKEADGVWIEFEPGTKFRIASSNSKAYRRAYMKRLGELRKAKPSEIEADQITRDAYAEAILLGWEGVTKNGERFEFSKDNAKWILENCPTVRSWIIVQAQEIENFKLEKVEEAKAKTGES